MMVRPRFIALVLASAALLAGCALGGPSNAPATTWPSSIAVLGHSGATGYNSDPAKPGEDAKTNSWATGTNPEVNSVYLQALAQSPALEGHFTNAASSGSDVGSLPAQVEVALKQDPLPDLFIIQSVDNDIRCDGSDDTNEAAYGEKISAVLKSIADAAPDAVIYVVGEWATAQNYADVVAMRPELVAQNQGDGVCDNFDGSGQQRPEGIAGVQAIADAYGEQLRSSCETFPTCTYGGDEIRNMVITDEDLTSDGGHLTISGLKKMAAVAWERLNQIREG